MSVVTTVRDFASAFAIKFFKEGLPVAFATAIAALVVGQYNRPIVVQAPAVAQPAPPQQPAQPERIVDLLKREPEITPATLAPPKPAVAQEERRPRVTPEKAVKHAAKPTEKKPEPLPVVIVAPVPPVAAPPPPGAALPLAPPVAMPVPPEPRVGTEWVGLLPLPTRLTGTVDRALDDAPVPPMPVPEAGARM
jgi:hypothetical protein